MFRQILVPLDGSELAENVLAHLPALLAPGGRVTLLRVLRPERRGELDGDTEASAGDALRQVAESLSLQGIDCDWALARGSVAEEIHRCRSDLQADLIAMSTHGRSGVERWVIGSVADRVVRRAEVPLYLIRAGTRPPTVPPRHILVPLDGSELAQRALPVARMVARSNRARLTLLSVLDDAPLTEFDQLLANVAGEPVEATKRSERMRYLNRIINLLRMSGVAAQPLLLRGPVADTILEAAADADMIVMSTHGRTGVRRWVFGSVANQVLLGSTCPLLLTRSAPAGTVMADERWTRVGLTGGIESTV